MIQQRYWYFLSHIQLVISRDQVVTFPSSSRDRIKMCHPSTMWHTCNCILSVILGTRTLVLNKLARPCRSSRYCGTKRYDPSIRKDASEDFVDLFQCKSIRGWWGCWKNDSLTGDPEVRLLSSLTNLTRNGPLELTPQSGSQNEGFPLSWGLKSFLLKGIWCKESLVICFWRGSKAV